MLSIRYLSLFRLKKASIL